jgi:hypothetical protein
MGSAENEEAGRQEGSKGGKRFVQEPYTLANLTLTLSLYKMMRRSSGSDL